MFEHVLNFELDIPNVQIAFAASQLLSPQDDLLHEFGPQVLAQHATGAGLG